MGQRRCCIPDCKSQSNLPEHSHVTFHSFPTNVVLRDVWIKNCRIEQNRSLTKSVVVCSRHFVDGDDFQAPRNGKRMLKNGATPTKFAWGTGLTYEQYLLGEHEKEKAAAAAAAVALAAAATDAADSTTTATAHIDTNDTPITAASASESCETPKPEAATSHATKIAQSAKKSSSRLRAANAEADSAKSRSTSADEPVPTNAKADKASGRKSIDSGQPADKVAGEVKSPLKRLDTVSTLATGAKVEVRDLNGSWHAARVVEVDQTEQEVFINFEKSVKAKGPSFRLNDEWIPMDSSRLRVPSLGARKAETLAEFNEGDRVLARWTDSRKFPGTVNRVLDNNKFEIVFDDGCVKSVKGNHISKQKKSAADTSAGQQTANASGQSTPLMLPVAPSPIPRKVTKMKPIPKFDLSKFNLPEIPADGEWCCPWINDTPIGRESYLTNTDGNRRPTVLVDDGRLPGGWTKHLYQRSSTSGKWDVVLVGPNNKRFRSKNDVKSYLDELAQAYNPDVYDFSIHKRRAKDLGVYVFTEDYVPPMLAKPNESKYDIGLDASLGDIKQEPFPGFAPHEASSSFLSGLGTSFGYDPSTPIKLEPADEAAGFTQIGSLRVQIKNNLYHCPSDGCNKTFRKENIFQIHVKHYHPDLMTQIGECPNMAELAYFRTKGTPDENAPKGAVPLAPAADKAKSMSPVQIKIEPRPEDQSTPLPPIAEAAAAPLSETALKRKHTSAHAAGETREKRKATHADKVAAPEPSDGSKAEAVLTSASVDEVAAAVAATPLTSRKADAADEKPAGSKALIPRFKIGKIGRAGKITKRDSGRGLKKKLKRGDLKRRALAPAASMARADGEMGAAAHGPLSRGMQPARGHVARSRLKYLQYRNENAPAIVQRGNSRYINENGELIKIVRMRQEEIINCLCTYPEEDGLMIQCELCLCWQHGGCNGIEKECEVPDKYVCFICRNPERGRESMQYLHDQDWLYDGKLPHANYHQPSRNVPQRTDILKQSHSLTGNLVELKRSIHSLNVKISIAGNKDHPKLYLWSKKWEQSPTKATATVTAVELADNGPEAREKGTPAKHSVGEPKASDHGPSASAAADGQAGERLTNGTASSSSEERPKDEADAKDEAKLAAKQSVATPVNARSKKQAVQVAPTIPEPEAAIDTAECQLRLMEHIQKEQNALMSRMQTIDAHIMALEAMDDQPNSNLKADFARTSQTIRMLLRDVGKMRKLAAINETTVAYNAIDTKQYI